MFEKIGERLEGERHRLKRTQEWMADYLKVTSRTYINYEKNKTKITGEAMQSLALLNADINYILTGERLLCAKTEDEKALLTDYRMLNEEEKSKALNIIKQMPVSQNGTHIHGAIGQYVNGDGQYVAGHAHVPFKVAIEKKSDK